MIAENGRQSSRLPPVLVIGPELSLMIDLSPRDVRVDDDRVGAALVLEERSMLVPYGRRIALGANEQHVGWLQGVGKHNADVAVLFLV